MDVGYNGNIMDYTHIYIYIYIILYNYISWNVYHIARTTNICISNPFSLQVPLHHSSSFNSSSRRAASAAACCGSVALALLKKCEGSNARNELGIPENQDFDGTI